MNEIFGFLGLINSDATIHLLLNSKSIKNSKCFDFKKIFYRYNKLDEFPAKLNLGLTNIKFNHEIENISKSVFLLLKQLISKLPTADSNVHVISRTPVSYNDKLFGSLSESCSEEEPIIEPSLVASKSSFEGLFGFTHLLPKIHRIDKESLHITDADEVLLPREEEYNSDADINSKKRNFIEYEHSTSDLYSDESEDLKNQLKTKESSNQQRKRRAKKLDTQMKQIDTILKGTK